MSGCVCVGQRRHKITTGDIVLSTSEDIKELHLGFKQGLHQGLQDYATIEL